MNKENVHRQFCLTKEENTINCDYMGDLKGHYVTRISKAQKDNYSVASLTHEILKIGSYRGTKQNEGSYGWCMGGLAEM